MTSPAALQAPSNGSPLLNVADLSIRNAGGQTLVREVSLHVGRGEAVGIVGESGSGKSLTARAITGLLPSGLTVSGSVGLGDLEILGAREAQLRGVRGNRVSLLMQDPFTMLNPLQTAAAHIIESLPHHVLSRKDQRAEVEERLAEVGLGPDVAERYPFQLSGGMRQRLALAAALSGDPELLIADEPTTALDVTTQSEVLDLIRRLQRERGMALMLITHDLGVAFSICERIHVMYAGSMIESGPADELAARPGHPYTVGLRLAEPPLDHYTAHLNAIPGRVPTPDDVADQCSFADRCAWARDVCVAENPALIPLDEVRASACVRIDEIRDDLRSKIEVLRAGDARPPATAGGPLLKVDDLRKSFRTSPMLGRARTVHALKGVSFRLDAGESLGLVGETGSGKSTIARLLLGLNTADGGRIALDDLDLSSYRKLARRGRDAARQRVQMVFQDPYSSLNPARTVGSVLNEVLAVRTESSGGRPHAAELLKDVGLPQDYLTRRPSQLSGGERQRVAIARALALQPDLLVCDEPVAALDVSAQAQVIDLLRDLRDRRRMAMLFITHDLSVVRQVAERLIVLLHGEIVESGPVDEVLSSPQHPYTQRLVRAARETREEVSSA